jgi:hypothetical protein
MVEMLIWGGLIGLSSALITLSCVLLHRLYSTGR